jgi:ribosomal protein L9
MGYFTERGKPDTSARPWRKDGYARNFSAARQSVRARRQQEERDPAPIEGASRTQARANEVSAKLDGVKVVIIRQAGETEPSRFGVRATSPRR